MKKLWVTMAMLLSACAQMTPAGKSYVVAPHSSVLGKPLGEYASEWWQWSFSVPLDNSPVKDVTGEKCATAQQGDVWFLAGTYERSAVVRRCAIPYGKYVFFPVINMVYWRPVARSVSCDAVKEGAAVNNDGLRSIEVEIDGKMLDSPKQYREASPECFDVFARAPKGVRTPPGYPAATDGYWVMLRPMPVGKHSIRFRARYEPGGDDLSWLRQDVSYEITITKP